jgi:hypothetical protein
VVEQQHLESALAGDRRAVETGGTGPDHDRVELHISVCPASQADV